MYKFISVVLTLCMLFGTLSITAQATEGVKYYEAPSAVSVYSYPTQTVNYSLDVIDEAIETARKAVQNYESEIDLSKYKISLDDLTQFVYSLDYTCAELFKRDDFEIYYSSDSSGTYVNKFYIEYFLSKDEFLAKQKKFFKEVKRIVSTVNKKYSDIEKVLYIHDYLVSNFNYDKTLSTNYGAEVHDSYNFLFSGVGVCQAYASTFQILMEQLGIESRVAVSPTHAWNIVELDGKFYHVDTTQDDPVYTDGTITIDHKGKEITIPNIIGTSPKGIVHHTYFLLSDSKLNKIDIENQSNDHSNFDVYPPSNIDIKCTDTKYENYYWQNIDTPLVEYNNKWYGIHYIYDESTYFFDCYIAEFGNISNNDHTHVFEYLPMHGWLGSFSGLTAIGNTLYFNTENSLYSFNLKTKSYNKLVTFDSEHDIYSCYYDGKGKMHFITSESPNNAPDAAELEAYNIGMGDVNNDGMVSAPDLLKLQQYLLGTDTMDNYGLADIVYDHEVNVLDLIRMKKFLSGTVSLF